MVDGYVVHIEPLEPSGVMLTVEALPRLVIFGESAEGALRRAREAIGFQLRETLSDLDWPVPELLPREPSVPGGGAGAGTRSRN